MSLNRWPEHQKGAMSTRLGDSETNVSGKVAIPRQRGVQNAQLSRRRVRRACDPCRQRKKKCNGNHPICDCCDADGIDCSYSASKRENQQVNLERLEQKVKDYESLLSEVVLQCPQENLKWVLDIIAVSRYRYVALT